jgi:hypothetical protein
MLNTSVARAGPPPEMVHTMSKVRKASMARMTDAHHDHRPQHRQRDVAERAPGAGGVDLGGLERLGRQALQAGQQQQREPRRPQPHVVSRMAQKAVHFCVSQAIGAMPNTSRITFTMPNCR